jgi:hypothetical protein
MATCRGLLSGYVRRADTGQGGKEAHAGPRAAERRACQARGETEGDGDRTGAGLGAGAGVLLVYAIGFAFVALAAGLSETISLWLSLLIVAGILFLAAAIAAFLAVRFVRKASPPTPAQALEEAARTLETFEGHV